MTRYRFALFMSAAIQAATSVAGAQTLPTSTQPATAAAPTSAPISSPARVDLPNAVLCSPRRWALENQTYAVAQQILATLPEEKQVTQTSTGRKAPATPTSRPAPTAFTRPITSLADIEGLTAADLHDGVFRQYSPEEHLNYARRIDRPLIVNWIEDYPKILQGQCQHWGTPTRNLAEACFPEPDLAAFKSKLRNEFEFQRMEEEYATLQARRAANFYANLQRGPVFNTRRPVVFVMRATCGEYDFQNQRFELKSPMNDGAVLLKDYFKVPGRAFDAGVVLIGQGRPWIAPCLPLSKKPAEKLRDENAELLVIIEGNVNFINAQLARLSTVGPERTILLYMSKVTFIAVPESGPLYSLASFDVAQTQHSPDLSPDQAASRK